LNLGNDPVVKAAKQAQQSSTAPVQVTGATSTRNEGTTMADKEDATKNAEQTLLTLEQLSQTLEVMTCVVDRLKTHLTRQMSLNAELFHDEEKLKKAQDAERAEASKKLQQESFVVEITQREIEEGTKGKKVVH
jgi:regulator of replication initiation timing